MEPQRWRSRSVRAAELIRDVIRGHWSSAVALAASFAFASPVGYRRMMVFGPGGYRFMDFVKVGAAQPAVVGYVCLSDSNDLALLTG